MNRKFSEKGNEMNPRKQRLLGKKVDSSGKVVENLRFGMRDLLVVARRLLSCAMHAGSSYPTREQTWAPCTGSVESYPLDHQGSPKGFLKSKAS